MFQTQTIEDVENRFNNLEILLKSRKPSELDRIREKLKSKTTTEWEKGFNEWKEKQSKQ